MKQFFLILQFFLFIFFNLSLLLTGYQLITFRSSINKITQVSPEYVFKEEFDSSLKSLNSVQKLVSFCDGLYMEKARIDTSIKFGETYPEILSSVIQKRFYHGYSMYGFSNNYMAKMLSILTMDGLSAIVVPDDILKYPKAACSQQSIVFMEALRQKGFSTRKVGFKGKKNGHFCFEVYYDGGWHFYDPDMEPNSTVIDEYNRPNIEFLVNHRDILLKAYAHIPNELVLDIFPNYFYGPVNAFPAPKAIIFQKVSQTLSYTIWLFFLTAFFFARKRYKKLKILSTAKNANQGSVLALERPIHSFYYSA